MPTLTVPQTFALALQHHQAGRLAEAESMYRQILLADSRHAEALHHLGVIAHQVGRPEQAVELIRQAIALEPRNPTAHFNLSESYRAQGRLEEAISSMRRAIELQPDLPMAHFKLGKALAELGAFDSAVPAFERALALQPGHAEAANRLGIALRKQGRIPAAVAAFQTALACQPPSADAAHNLGNALLQQGKRDEAAEAYRRALELKSELPEVWNNLGAIREQRGESDEATEAYRRALALKPSYAEAWNNLGHVLQDTAEIEPAIHALRKAVDLDTGTASYLSDLILAFHLSPSTAMSATRQAQDLWNQRYAEPLAHSLPPPANTPDLRRRLKIGYVSPDFRLHAVAFFVAPLLQAHDRAEFEVYCYASVAQPDAVTERLRVTADVWRDVSAMSDAQLAECVRQDGIDILVDLAMHTAGNRLLALARQPAPVQISWLAYAGSSGMKRMNFRLTDSHIDPPEAKTHPDEEEPIRLPDSWCCYAPVAEFPAVGPLPASRTGIVTFGSLNQFCKIHEGLLRCWASLLQSVPNSRLIMICPAGGSQTRTHARFAEQGIPPERVELVAPRPWSEYIRLHERIDVALDSFPCNGMTTTCHALWMGVPVVALAGDSPMFRASSSPLHTIGLSSWIAHAAEEYVRLAGEAVNDLSALADLRTALRERMRNSPLMNTQRFSRNVETAYRTLWTRWCAEKQS